MREKTFENKIKLYLKSQNCWFVKFFANSYTKIGVPDILVCCNGRFVGIEVKSEKGRPSELQLYNRDQIRESGGFSVICHPKQFSSLTKMIEMLQNDRTTDARMIERGFDDESKPFKS